MLYAWDGCFGSQQSLCSDTQAVAEPGDNM